MNITKIQIAKGDKIVGTLETFSAPYIETIYIHDDEGNKYKLTKSDITRALEDNGELCEHCENTGEIVSEEPVWPGEPQMAPTGFTPCICQD